MSISHKRITLSVVLILLLALGLALSGVFPGAGGASAHEGETFTLDQSHLTSDSTGSTNFVGQSFTQRLLESWPGKKWG